MTIEPCPHCGIELDDGDIFDKLKNKDKTDEEVTHIALQYGWTQQNQKRFSKRVVVRSIDGGTHYIKCPYCHGCLSSH